MLLFFLIPYFLARSRSEENVSGGKTPRDDGAAGSRNWRTSEIFGCLPAHFCVSGTKYRANTDTDLNYQGFQVQREIPNLSSFYLLYLLGIRLVLSLSPHCSSTRCYQTRWARPRPRCPPSGPNIHLSNMWVTTLYQAVKILVLRKQETLNPYQTWREAACRGSLSQGEPMAKL